MKLSKSNLLITILLVVILILSYINIFKKPDLIEVQSFDDTKLRKEIAKSDSVSTYWQQEVKKYQNKALYFEAKSDGLELLKSQINNYYDQIYKFNSTASSSELDSVIRANW